MIVISRVFWRPLESEIGGPELVDTDVDDAQQCEHNDQKDRQQSEQSDTNPEFGQPFTPIVRLISGGHIICENTLERKIYNNWSAFLINMA